MIETMLRRLLVSASALAILMTSVPAFSQTPMDDPLDARDARRVDRMEKVVRELRSIVFQARDTGKPVVVQPAETEFQMQELQRRVEDLEQTLTRINSSLEQTTFNLDQMKRDNDALRGQVQAQNDRLAALQQAMAPPPADTGMLGPDPAPGPAGPSAADAFASARQLMLDGNYDGAENGFRDYVARFPDTPRTPEARYWLGKTLAVRGAHSDAAATLIEAIRGFPQTAWAPDAMVELSRSLVALKQPAQACQTLAALPKRYPKASPTVTNRAAATRALAKCA
jgi:tol-pal system protein YbgF